MFEIKLDSPPTQEELDRFAWRVGAERPIKPQHKPIWSVDLLPKGLHNFKSKLRVQETETGRDFEFEHSR